jgi:hypothetical protein
LRSTTSFSAPFAPASLRAARGTSDATTTGEKPAADTIPRVVPANQHSSTGLSAPYVKQIGVDIVPARHVGYARTTCQALLDDPSLLRWRPSPSSLGAGKNRRGRHDCAH